MANTVSIYTVIKRRFSATLQFRRERKNLIPRNLTKYAASIFAYGYTCGWQDREKEPS